MSLVVTGRLRALTMPAVTVELSPSGEPKATTWSPTRSTCARAQARRRQAAPPFTYSTARSYVGLRPDHLRGVLVAVLVDDLDRPVVLDGVGDDVVVGDVVARPVEHEAGPGGAVLLALVLREHLDRARQQPLGDRRRPSGCRPAAAPVDTVPASARPPLTRPSVESACRFS